MLALCSWCMAAALRGETIPPCIGYRVPGTRLDPEVSCQSARQQVEVAVEPRALWPLPMVPQEWMDSMSVHLAGVRGHQRSPH